MGAEFSARGKRFEYQHTTGAVSELQ